MHPIFLFFALLGHVFLWIGLVNRLHAIGIRRWIIKLVTAACFACMAALPATAWWIGVEGEFLPGRWPRHPGSLAVLGYLVACWIAAAATLLRLIHYRILRRPPRVVSFHRRRPLHVAPVEAAGTADKRPHHFLTRLPGNQILGLELSEWILDVPRLGAALDGLSIVHLSDLHFTGRVGKSYFREVMNLCNELDPDLVAITGDLVDDSECIAWIPDTLGRLAARHGVCYVLGNHDIRVDLGRLRGALIASGLIDLGGRWLQMDVRGEPVILAGNELPWIGPAADMTTCPPRVSGRGPLRIVLSHSPDQLPWARANDADLMLAGHTHGGQIRIPPLGAIFSPTFEGVKYISGVFHEPPTILHVSRGISGDVPVRLNCPPEMALLKLRTAKTTA
jgi:hypothetical protein